MLKYKLKSKDTLRLTWYPWRFTDLWIESVPREYDNWYEKWYVVLHHKWEGR